MEAANKRSSNRRLTAIGIEEALECVRKPPETQTPSCGASRLNPSLGVSYFEPPQLIKAPLIDDDDDDDDEDPLTSGSEAPAIVESVAKASVVKRADRRHQQQVAGGAKKLLAHQQAAALIQNRCLNSISDLHSFSSTSNSVDDQDNSAENDDEHEDDDDDDDESHPSTSDSAGNGATNNGSAEIDRRRRDVDKSDDRNFVSSRSFIKCYYGRESNASERSETEAAKRRRKDENKASDSAAKPTDNRKVRAKRQGGDKLLGLIGLGSSGAGSSNTQPTAGSDGHGRKVLAQAKSGRPLVMSPIAAMFVAAQQQQQQQHHHHHHHHNHQQQQQQQQRGANTPLVGEFLNSEGPILVRDRRIAALRSDLVRHYQHPTVQVAKVPNFATKHRQKASGGEAKQQKERLLLADQIAGSTNTTNSTSSYEAAIKNSRSEGLIESSAKDSATSNAPLSLQQNRHAKKASSQTASATSSASQSALIKVPKLSKQSHLLNRPLPKPPVSSSSGCSRRTGAAALTTSAKHYVAHPSTKSPMPTSSKRKALVFTNLDSAAGSDASKRSVGGGEFGVKEEQKARSVASSGLSGTRQMKAAQQAAKVGGHGSSLSPLAVSITAHSSPTVTTCTSSGISSRLTAGTHLASNGSSQRSATGKAAGEARVKSFTTLHKQSKLAASADQAANSAKLATADFALMDDHQLDACGQQTLSSPDVDADIDVYQDVELKHNAKDAHQQCGDTNMIRKKEAVAVNSNNLRLFDERFSAKFMDQQLASSNDSLLESINFSGTLNRKLAQIQAKQSATAAKIQVRLPFESPLAR